MKMNVYVYEYAYESIIIIPLAKLPKINLCMAKRTVFKITFFNLRLIHFMPTCFTSIIIPSNDGLATDNTSWEIATTTFTSCIIFTYHIRTILPWAFYTLSRCLFWRMLCKYTHCHIYISLSLLWSTHTLQLNKCP